MRSPRGPPDPHLSDTHLTASGFDEDGVDAVASLRRILHDARRLAGLDLVIVMRAVKGASATVIDLGGPFSPAFHVIHARDPEAGEQVYLVDPSSSWEPVEAEDPARRT